MVLYREAATPVRPRPLGRRRCTTLTAAAVEAAAAAASAVGNDSRCEVDCPAGSANDDTAESKQPRPSPRQSQLEAFAAAMTRPVSSQETSRSFELLRALLPHRFAELCKVHLSFLVDVPADFLDDAELLGEGGRRRLRRRQGAPSGPNKWLRLRQHVRSSMKLKMLGGGCRPDAAAGYPAELPSMPGGATATAITSDLAAAESLLARLAAHAATVEGLFRKCGSASRQRGLLLAAATLATGPDSDHPAGCGCGSIGGGGCTPHDLAGALKASLATLAEPLLTDRLLPYFQQVGRLVAPPGCADAADAGRAAILAARRLKGFRLLVQLLPPQRRAFLGRLLALLGRTGASPITRMTPESLGTVFGPVLLYPRGADEADGLGDACHLAGSLNSAAAFMVRHAESLMQIPDSIAQDADRILRRLRRSPTSSAGVVDSNSVNDDDDAGDDDEDSCRVDGRLGAAGDEEVGSLSVRFAAGKPRRRGLVDDDDGDFTRQQVAALFAAVQAMPDSAKRRRLIRRFNRTNGGLHLLPPAAASAASLTSASPASPTKSRSVAEAATALISSPVFGRLFDFPMRCLSPEEPEQ